MWRNPDKSQMQSYQAGSTVAHLVVVFVVSIMCRVSASGRAQAGPEILLKTFYEITYYSP